MITYNSSGILLSSNYQRAVQSDSRDFLSKILVDGTELDCTIGRFTIEKGSCASEDQFIVGDVIASRLDAQLKGVAELVKGQDIEVQIGLFTGQSYEWVTLGFFTASIVKKNYYSTAITGYGYCASKTADAFVDPSTRTLANIASSIQTTTGVPVIFDASIDTTIAVEKSMDGLTCYGALKELASLVGGYVKDTNDGKIKVCQYSNLKTLDVSTGMMVKLPDVEEEDHIVGGVKYVVQEGTDTQQEISYEVGEPSFTMYDEYMTQTLMTNVGYLTDYWYRAGVVELSLGDPRLEGDDVLFINGMVFSTDGVYILRSTDGVLESTEGVLRVNMNSYVVPCHKVVHTYDGGFFSQITAVTNLELGAQPEFTTRLESAEKTAQNAEATASEAMTLAGSSVASDTLHYLATPLSSGVTVNTPGWTTQIQTMDATNKYLWTYHSYETADGASLPPTTPVITGRYGTDGTSVTILGSYDTRAELEQAHPTGSLGDAYMVAGDLYVWNGTAWENVGQIQGPQGAPGDAGASYIYYGARSWSEAQVTNYTSIGYTDTWNQTLNIPVNAGDLLEILVTRTEQNNQIWSLLVKATTDATASQDPTGEVVSFTQQTGNRGAQGSSGVSVTAVQPLYYLHTSPTATQQEASGWQWGTTFTYEDGKYIWTRDMVSYSNGNTGYSTAIYNEALTNACADALEAIQLAQETSAYFWYKNGTGEEVGAHITEIPQEDFLEDPTGNNVYIDADSIDIRDGTTVLARFGADGAVIGQGDADHIEISDTQIVMRTGDGLKVLSIDDTSSTMLGEVSKDLGIGSLNSISLPLSYTIQGDVESDYYIFLTVAYRRSINGVLTDSSYTFEFIAGTAETITSLHLTTARITAVYDGDKTISITAYTDTDSSATPVGIMLQGITYWKLTPTPACGIGVGVEASAGQLCIGKYNDNDPGNAFEIGNGTSEIAENIAEIDWGGNLNAKGSVISDFNFSNGWNNGNNGYTKTVARLASGAYLGVGIRIYPPSEYVSPTPLPTDKHPIFNGFDILGSGTSAIHTLGHYIYKESGYWYAYIKMQNGGSSAVTNFTVTAYIAWI